MFETKLKPKEFILRVVTLYSYPFIKTFYGYNPKNFKLFNPY
jgi:hypothetical protein